MPSVRYYNQTAPFWDFIASMEEQGTPPFFAGNNNNSDNQHPPSNPWTEGWTGFPFGPMPHHGRRGSHHGRRHSQHPPPPPQQEANATPNETAQDPEEVAPEPRGLPPPFTDEPTGPRSHDYPHQGPGPHHGRHGGRGRGGWGGRGRGGPFAFGNGGPMGGFGGMSGLGDLAEMFQSQMFGQDESSKKESTQDFKPEADVFDTETSFVVHVSLPGAKKEDISVSWSADSSQLIIAGVVHRPGDEELLKNLALDERKVGAFERKVRLGSRANPAQVDADSISAKLEDGVLRIDVPKLDSEYVEIKKVDIE